MIRSIPRAVAVALLGALAGPVCLAIAYATRPALSLDVERLLPLARGFYQAERSGRQAFAWTSREASIALAGIDRRSAWTCSVRARGARPPSASPQPDVTISAGGAIVSRPLTNDFEDVEVTAPERPGQRDLTITITSSSTFVPGPGDRRTLGIQVERVVCRPAGTLVVLPPRAAMASASLAGAAFGAALALSGITAGSAVLGTAAMTAAQAIPLSSGAGPYLDYTATVARVTAVISVLMLVAIGLVQRLNRQPLRNTARFVIIFSAGALSLKLIALFHPAKLMVDALFHAHRFEWVLAGNFYFTQLSTSATPFPYAIGLYLFAAPWAQLTGDHVALLRVVVSAADVVAGALLYLMVVRTWGDRMAGAIAAALYNLVPLAYAVIGFANLTNAFGQSVAAATIAAVTLWRIAPGRLVPMLALILLATFAFISHVSILVVLPAVLISTALLFWWRGDIELRLSARGLLVATLVALVLSVVLYWGHFGDVYAAQIRRVRATTASASASRGPVQATEKAVPGDAATKPALGRKTIPLGGRIAGAAVQTRMNLGWPILILAVIGVWRVWMAGLSDRLVRVLGGCGIAWFAVTTAAIVLPSEMRYQQDAWEFIGRVEHATYAAAIILAGFGAAWAWRAGTWLRVASGALLIWALAVGVRAWLVWFS